MGIHDKAINIFSLKLKPAKHINTNVKEIRINNAKLMVATQMPTTDKNKHKQQNIWEVVLNLSLEKVQENI